MATPDAYREAALHMLDRLPASTRRRTLGADRGYDTQAFVREVRERGITPHVAQTIAAAAARSMRARLVTRVT